jgi:hypothetical protein
MFAVVHRVFCAFRMAGFTGCGAKGTYRLDVFTASADGRRSEAANIGTLQVQRDAPDHGFGVRLFQAGGCALKAGRRAFIARAEAIDFFLTQHF